MRWQDELNSLHRRAMEHADFALHYKRLCDLQRSLQENHCALELEEQAADVATRNGSPEPTRTILLRSAATLALRCNDPGRAERLAAMALLGNGPDSVKQDARDVIRKIRVDWGRYHTGATTVAPPTPASARWR